MDFLIFTLYLKKTNKKLTLVDEQYRELVHHLSLIIKQKNVLMDDDFLILY